MIRGEILWLFALYYLTALEGTWGALVEIEIPSNKKDVPCSLHSPGVLVEIDPTGTTLDLFPASFPLSVDRGLSFAGLHGYLHNQFKTMCIEAAALHSASRLFKDSEGAPGLELIQINAQGVPEYILSIDMHSGPSESSPILKSYRMPSVDYYSIQSRKSTESGLEYRRQMFSDGCIASAVQLSAGWTIDDCVGAMEAQVAVQLAKLAAAYTFQGAEGKWSGELYNPGFDGSAYGISWGGEGCAADLFRQVDEWVVSKCEETPAAEGGGEGETLRRPPHPFVLSGLELSTVALAFPSTKPAAESSNDARLSWPRDLILQRTALDPAVPNALTVRAVSLLKIDSLEALHEAFRPQFVEVCAQNLQPSSDLGESWTAEDCAHNLNDQLTGFVTGVSNLLFDPLPPTPPRFLSVGIDCAPSGLLSNMGLKQASSPFDWTVCPLGTVAAVLSGEMTNITANMTKINHSGGNEKVDSHLYLHKPFSALSSMMFPHDGDCDEAYQTPGVTLVMNTEEQRSDGRPMKPCSMGASFHEKYARRMARFQSSIFGVDGKKNHGGITYLVYYLQPKQETRILNETTFPEYTIENQRAAVSKLKSIFRRREDIRVLSIEEVLPFARRECVAKLRRQRKISLLLGRHKVVSMRDGPVTLSDPMEINEALQIFSNQFCSLTGSNSYWGHF